MVSSSLRSFITLLGALSASALPHVNVKRDGLPDYVLAHAPISHLYSGESYWPSDISDFITHVRPEINFGLVDPAITLENVTFYGSNVALTSIDDQTKSSSIPWMLSDYGKPDGNGKSGGPATIIAVEKSGGIVDAFYFYFYSFNFGPAVLGQHWGNHVGDVEYSMVRFINGVPTYIYLSVHNGGTAYNYNAMEQTNGRATTYIATGSHANYAKSGQHDYSLPFGLLHDTTDGGPIWDVTLNYRGFFYDVSSQKFTSAGGADVGGSEQQNEGVGWLTFPGKWGDAQWPTSRKGQFCVSSECHISDGPTGPGQKNLGRTAVCENESSCTIQSSI